MLQRYRVNESVSKSEEDANGEWVKFADVEKLVKRIAELEAEVKSQKEQFARLNIRFY